ncbi:MAG: hypothetical protein LBP29_09870 [Treponema sp.]|jgi:hypothetical protein|nr:hypothetical protein [Treponema sp.]
MELDQLLKIYRCGQIDRKELETRIFFRIKENVMRFRFEKMDKENCNDFVSWLYPRIKNAVDHYKDCGSTFDSYINVLVKLSAREYCLRKKDHEIIERTWWNTKAEEMMVCEEEEPEYFEPKQDFSRVRNRKQVLFLLLKSYHFLSDDYISRAAPAIGMDREELKNMVDTLRNQRLGQEERIRELRERVYSQFYRCLAFENRMRAFPPGSRHGREMKKRLEGAKKRLAAMRKRLASIRIDAPNWQIANLLDSKKGTVDSSLHVARRNHERNHTAQK